MTREEKIYAEVKALNNETAANWQFMAKLAYADARRDLERGLFSMATYNQERAARLALTGRMMMGVE